MTGPIRIFVGSEPKTEIARLVLEHSIREHTAAAVEFTPMIGRAWEYPTNGLRFGTGFSLRRWMIPAACNWEGRAIYLDADIQAMADVAELWDMPVRYSRRGCSAWTTFQPDAASRKPRPQSSVMVIDCEAAGGQRGWQVDEILRDLRRDASKVNYAGIMHAGWLDPAPMRIPDEWNRLHIFVPGSTKMLHFTKVPDQPMFSPRHPVAAHWQDALKRAIIAGVIPKVLFIAHLNAWGHKLPGRNEPNGLHPSYRAFLRFFRA